MKKFLMLVILALSFSMISCGNNLEKSFEKMEELDSYTMEITMSNIPIFGSMTILMKTDGDMLYTSNIYSGETYSKFIDGEEYVYIENNGEYVLSDTPIESDDDNIDSGLLDTIDFEDFEKDDNGDWVLKTDKVYLDDEETTYMRNVTITVNDDGYITSMTFEMMSEGMKIDVEALFSDFNDTEVQLPS